MYSKRTWLNDDKSPSTGSVVSYCGPSPWDGPDKTSTFIEFSDCHCKVRLHKSELDTMDDFIRKLQKISIDINEFIEALAAYETREGE